MDLIPIGQAAALLGLKPSALRRVMIETLDRLVDGTTFEQVATEHT